MTDTHLWDVDHPYYGAIGDGRIPVARWGESGVHAVYSSWSAFLTRRAAADLDCALIWRWDWAVDEHDDGLDTLKIYGIWQDLAICWSAHVMVSATDEPAVRAWLAPRAAKLAELWAPLLADKIANPVPADGAQ